MLTIVWDVDDVLNELTKYWFEKTWIKLNPGCKITYKDLIENPPHKILGVSLDEYLNSLDSFRLSQEAEKLEPVLEVISWFKEYGHYFRHIALTSAPIISVHSSAMWVLRHFGCWIRSFNFVPSGRKGLRIPIYDENKANFLSWFGKADILIDDNASIIASAMRLNIKTILFPRPWNDNNKTIHETLELLNKFIYYDTNN